MSLISAALLAGNVVFLGAMACGCIFMVVLYTRDFSHRAKSSVFSLLRKTCNDGDDWTDSSKQFQSNAAVAGKVRSPVVERTLRGRRGATSTDVVEERSHRRALRCDMR